VVNRVGLPQTTLPTFLNFPHFHAFCDGGLGMVWDSNKFNMDDLLNVNEREQTIGFCINITTMFSTSKRAYKYILGQIMDMNCMTWIFSLTLAKQTHLAHSFPHTHLPHPFVAPHLKCPWWCKGGICGNTRCTSLAYVG